MSERKREAQLGQPHRGQLPGLHSDLEEELLRLVGRGLRWSHHGHHLEILLELVDLCNHRYLTPSSIVM
jgi:hypothetical protein